MLDPFPLPPPQWLAKATQPVADYLSLPTLPLHIHEVLLAAIFYHLVQTRLSPWISPKLAPKSYPFLNARTKLNWDVHVVSFVQSVVVCSAAAYVAWKDDERRGMSREERVWGYTGGTGFVEAMGLGYFIWDLYITARHLSMFGIGMLAHAISACAVYGVGFRPFVTYYSPDFIFYELSSPFLNIHWFCDKTNMTGSTVQLVNGIFLITTFALCRLVWGSYASFAVLRDVFLSYRQSNSWKSAAAALSDKTTAPFTNEGAIMRFAGNRDVPLWLCLINLASNVTLNALNWYWINKMIATIRKRFDPPFGTRKPQEKGEKEVEVARGVYADGHKSVELDATEVRKRPTAQRAASSFQGPRS